MKKFRSRRTKLEILEALVKEMVALGITQEEMSRRKRKSRTWMCRQVSKYEGAIARRWLHDRNDVGWESSKALVGRARKGKKGSLIWDVPTILATMQAEGLTREDAIARWGMSYRTLARWLRGVDMPHFRRRG